MECARSHRQPPLPSGMEKERLDNAAHNAIASRAKIAAARKEGWDKDKAVTGFAKMMQELYPDD